MKSMPTSTVQRPQCPFKVPVGHADGLMGFIRDGFNARKTVIASMFP
jgi:hypothetical protein